MNAYRINQSFDLLSLALADTKLRRAGTYFLGPCPFCGGCDRFVLKHTQSGYRWYCRHCGGEKYRTSIDYIMRRNQSDFKAAIKQMRETIDNKLEMHNETLPIRKSSYTLPDHTWQTTAWREVDKSSDQILTGTNMYAQNYLLNRGLHRGTWNAWQLGFKYAYDPKLNKRRPAIVIPWMDTSFSHSVITAIKYRFIDSEPNGLRYTSLKGSVPILYGLENVLPSHHTLLVVEGEINALSIWQCIPIGVSCISIGSDTGHHQEILRKLAARYQNVFIWLDDKNKAGMLKSRLVIPSTALQSPLIEGEKWDANKLLQYGLLMGFISQRLDIECFGYETGKEPKAENNSR